MREDIMSTENFDVESTIKFTQQNVEKEWKRKDFKEFSYITVNPPTWAHWVTWIVTIAITAALCYWAVVNDFITDKKNAFKTKYKYGNW